MIIISLTILLLEKCSGRIKGTLTKWLFELKSGVFIGTLSSRVRKKIWMNLSEKLESGSAILIYPYPCEQGFKIETLGELFQKIHNFGGIFLSQSSRKKTADFPKIDRNRPVVQISSNNLNPQFAISHRKKIKTENILREKSSKSKSKKIQKKTILDSSKRKGCYYSKMEAPRFSSEYG